MALQIIGAGLGRTGTLSVRAALIELGFGPCYHMLEVARLGHAPFWARAASGERVDWEEIFATFESTVDWPAATYWRELLERYPTAKVLLTVRDPEAWFDSMIRTILSDKALAYLNSDACPAAARAMKNRYVLGTFGERFLDRSHAIEVFNRHNDEVRRAVPVGRLLAFDAVEGWEPLCRFLEVPIPATEFPKVNNSQEWQEMFLPRSGT